MQYSQFLCIFVYRTTKIKDNETCLYYYSFGMPDAGWRRL